MLPRFLLPITLLCTLALSGTGQAGAGHVAGVPTNPYTVRPGDTLAAIAARSGVGVGDLRRANGLSGDFLAAGQVLRVPVTHLPPPGQEWRTVYGLVAVQAGETLATIAQRHRTTPAYLQTVNGLSVTALYTRQRLRVPQRIAVPTPPPPLHPPVALHTRRPLGVPVQLVRVDLRHPGVLVSPVLPAGGNSARVGELARASGADAVINGSYFHPQTYSPAGDLVIGGRLLHWGRIPAALAITPDNRAVITGVPGTASAAAWRGKETVVASGPRILVGGEVRETYHPVFADPAVFGRAARSAVGLSGDRDLFLVTSAMPLTTTEMARVMRELGAQNALLLDGGSSAGLAWGGRAVLESRRSVAYGLGVFGNYPGRRFMR